ncbi:MAG: P-loop NTPase fold protein [Cyclobacteriaceae bacterium]
MDKPTVIGVTGGSGSGKTLFIQKLLESMPDVAVHSMDNYYIQRTQQPKDDQGVENFDTLGSINMEKYVEDLRSLIDGKTIELEEYNYNNPNSERKIIKIESASIILVEGIFALFVEDLRNLLDLKIFIEAPGFLMLKRRIIRDAEERGYDLNDVLYRFEHHVTPAFRNYIEPSRKWADVIIPNHDNFNKALEVILCYLNR